MNAMDQEDTMQGETGTDKPGMGESDNKEPLSVFLPKAALEGRKVKPGDTLTMKVKDVDPESGDVEAVCDYQEEQSEGEDMGSAFDRMVPESE